MKLSFATLSGLTLVLLLAGCATEETAGTPAAPAAAAAAAKPAAAVPRKVSFTTDIYFAQGKTTLNKAAKGELDQLVARAKTVKLEVIVATGHTDNVGSAKDKEKRGLSQAQAVKAYLLTKGIAANQVYTESKADKQPVAYNKSADGRARNRRVEVEVVGTK